MTIAWVFPGQGSQKHGMGKDVIQLEGSKARFIYASEIFKKDLFRICELSSPDNTIDDLNNTKNTQICLFLIEAILLDNLKKNGFKPNFVAGHSLGEITALYAADVLSFESCVELIRVRSELMSEALDGAMAAVIGFNRNELNDLVDKTKNLVIANDNSSSQVVLSGSQESIECVSGQITCKRFMKLNVSGAFHSPFMKDSSDKFSTYLDPLLFNNSSFPVISNYRPEFVSDAQELKKNLKKQMCNEVRWRETMNLMGKEDELHIVEIGPSNVLAGLAKRELKDIKISQVSSSANLFY